MDKKEKWTICDALRVLTISSLFGVMFLLTYKEHGIKGVVIVLGLCVGMWIAGVLAGGQYRH
jgi:glucose uptake protein GlcU